MRGLTSQIAAQIISSDRQCDLSRGWQTFSGKGLTVHFSFLALQARWSLAQPCNTRKSHKGMVWLCANKALFIRTGGPDLT